MGKKVKSENRLWYKKPAATWNEALPIGNGRLGAMVYGNVQREQVQLNEDSIWYGEPIDRNNPDALKNLHKIRQLLKEGRIKEAEQLASMALSGVPESQRTYQTMGNLFLDFDINDSEIEDYVRELDLEKAMVTVKFKANGVNYTRQYFSTFPDQAVVIRISADNPGKISLMAFLRRGRYLDEVKSFDNNTIAMYASCGSEKAVQFCTMVKAVNEGGKVLTIGENLVVEQADTVTLILSAATTFYHSDYENQCKKYLNNAANKNYYELYENHIHNYSMLYDRVSLSIDDVNGEFDPSILDTSERLKRMQAGEEDTGLICLYFQFGRYLLISCSRPGSLPANLQGIWNKDMLPSWDSKYTININTEMNYWPAEVCNLPECHEPLFDHIERMRVPGRITAKKMYDCRGFVAHHNTDIWADTAPQDIYIPASYWPMGAAWLCLHLWEHYEYGLEQDFLERAFPIMKEAAEFFLDFLIEDDKGRLVTSPSVSPENTYILDNGERGCLCIGPSMDSQILYTLFSSCIKAAEILGIEFTIIEQLQCVVNKLPKPEIGKYGQIQEWSEDYEEAELGHRHISHLFGLHPGNIFTVRKTPELAQAARRTLERRLEHGGGHTGWSRAWIINMWARLKDGTKAYENVLALLRKSTQYNMFDSHPPFQIDGNFGGTAGITEMIMQSHEGGLEFLPAIPHRWRNGKAQGLRARGGFTVDVQWHEGMLTKATIYSNCGSDCTIITNEKLNIQCNGAKVNAVVNEDGITFATETGKQYSIINTL
ncbi:MAG: glycoside hydrolase family 95 protein [Clostridiaceae bacterium]|nr:glycoside hydrolase family 95 protein [Clostridiaceae bacterium]